MVERLVELLRLDGRAIDGNEVAEELVNRGIYDFYGYSRLKSFSVVNKSRFEFECLDFDRNYFLVLSFYIFAFTILKEINYQTDLIFL